MVLQLSLCFCKHTKDTASLWDPWVYDSVRLQVYMFNITRQAQCIMPVSVINAGISVSDEHIDLTMWIYTRYMHHIDLFKYISRNVFLYLLSFSITSNIWAPFHTMKISHTSSPQSSVIIILLSHLFSYGSIQTNFSLKNTFQVYSVFHGIWPQKL